MAAKKGKKVDGGNKFSIEHAKSARSACHSCKTNIGAGEVRVGFSKSSGSYDTVSWYHVVCFGKIKNVTIDLEEAAGWAKLKKPEQTEALKSFATGRKAGKSSVDAVAAVVVAAEKADKKGAATAKKAAPKKKAGPLGGYTAVELKKYKENLKDLGDLGVAELKLKLKSNLQTQSGNKSDLIVRIADCMTMGTLPNCTKCGGGRLRYNQSTGDYFCKGYMDDADFINCSATFDRTQVVRGDWTN